MFTGIISNIGVVESADKQGDLRIKIASDLAADSLQPGESVAVNGACLTVVTKGLLASGKSYFTASLSNETLTRTAARWQAGMHVNLERALKLGDSLDGHMVTGHVDGVATIRSITPEGDSHVIELEAPAELARFIAEKGSLSLDGISLTVNKAEGTCFSVNIIPHSWKMTTLAERKAGDTLNLEIDPIARYVARLMQK